MLKVLLKNQAMTMVILDDLIDKINEDLTFDPVAFDNITKLRENNAMAQYNLFMAEIRFNILDSKD